jgi:hypothetical protein
MADGYDSHYASFIIDLIADPPITDTNAPTPFFGLYLQASVWTWIVSQSESNR